MKKICLYFLFLLTLMTGCSPLQHKSGEQFNTKVWTEGRNPMYIYGGELSGEKFYYLNPYWNLSDTVEFGLLVNGNRIVKSLNKEETEKVKGQIIAQDLKDKEIALKIEKDKRDSISQQTNKSTSKNNIQKNNSKEITRTDALLATFAIIHLQTTIFENEQRQWNNNVRYGAAPISAAYLRMINQEVPAMYRLFSVCTKKYGGKEVNPQTIMSIVNTDESLRMQFGLLGLMKGTVQTPTRQNLNSASEYELVLRLLLNKFEKDFKYKTDRNWCDNLMIN